jgi:RNA polymerase sigma-70 factor (ECF subfamily)
VSAARMRTARSLPRSDDELLHDVQAGDLGALGELYDRYAPKVWRAVQRTLGRDADVDDVVHTVFLKLPQLARSYDGRANAGPWLAGIAVRMALRHRRGAGRFFKMLTSFAQTIGKGAHADPEQHSSQRQELRAFEAALAELAPKKRAVFALIELEGLSTEQVAAALEIPAATVRTRLHPARREVQEAIAPKTAAESQGTQRRQGRHGRHGRHGRQGGD